MKQLDDKQILITGATGFIGSNLCKQATNEGWAVRPVTRRAGAVGGIVIEDITLNTDWSAALKNVDIVIHLAARVHIMDDSSNNPLEEFRRINTEATLNLAKQAAEYGIKRFIYLSSIKVNGESTQLGKPFTENDKYVPVDPYALSKYEAEQELLKLASETKMEVVIIRPPLVYGENVKANFLNMMKWLCKRLPLPFGTINNKRSLVALDNLVDFILTCVEHPAAANQIFFVSDDDDLSTSELLQQVAVVLGKKSRLFAINEKVIELSLSLIGKKDLAQRLCGSLQVDISKAKKLLNWTPIISVEEGLQKTAQHFIRASSND